MSNINKPSFMSNMKEEHAEIQHRVNAMEKYIYGDGSTFDSESKKEQIEMSKQLAHMQGHLAILNARIWARSGDNRG
jgi:hypothetical protein